MASPKITEALLDDYLRCPTKSHLRLRGITVPANEYLAMNERLETEYRTKASEATAANYPLGDVIHNLNSRRVELSSGKSLILGGIAEADDLLTHFDALERVPNAGSPSVSHYEPIRFCRNNRPGTVIMLLLAFDVLVLTRLLESAPLFGTVVYGADLKRKRISLRTHLEALPPILASLRLQAAGKSEPPLFLNRHCDVCRHKPVCRRKAAETDNLTLLKGVTAKEVARQNAKGIFTVKQLSYTFRPRRPAKRQTPQFPHSHALQALALRENKVHIHGTPNLPLPSTQIYLDIEGVPDRNFHYLIGVVIVSGDSETHHSFWADDESSQQAMFVELATLLSRFEDCRIFHYGNYEINALRGLASALPTTPKTVLEGILKNCVNVLSVLVPHVYFPVSSNGLKEVAGYLGFRWTEPDASGLQSIVWRDRWETSRDDKLKDRLILYNREDCSALRCVTRFIASLATNLPHEANGKDQRIVFTDELRPPSPRPHRFGKAEFCFPELDFVNKCAYFDYQRERVYIRPDGSRIKAPARKRRRPRRGRINLHVDLRPDRCAHCGHRRITQKDALSLTVVDLKFFNGGVKKWITQYSSWWFRCKKCRRVFRPLGFPETKACYGPSLMSWILYQNLSGGQSLERVRFCLGDVFKLDLHQGTVHRFKGIIAARYQPTLGAILTDLLRGPSLHLDETEARLRKDKAHVWVIAGACGAYYEYRQSRESDFLTDRLKDFTGVLVTDFFTGYDSLKCPQQKCLIHLIRDMNEDLRCNPFDAELKEIIQRFAKLLRSIIGTVDRHGLAKRYLQKHKSAALKFVEKVTAERPSTEAAIKFHKRIDKYGPRLFTFLDYDNVPWNNNNAEHAIHCFARHRQRSDGRFTEKSLTDCLTILTVFQTCEYRDVNVLDFLLSGKTNIGGSDEHIVLPISSPSLGDTLSQ